MLEVQGKQLFTYKSISKVRGVIWQNEPDGVTFLFNRDNSPGINDLLRLHELLSLMVSKKHKLWG